MLTPEEFDAELDYYLCQEAYDIVAKESSDRGQGWNGLSSYYSRMMVKSKASRMEAYQAINNMFRKRGRGETSVNDEFKVKMKPVAELYREAILKGLKRDT